MAELCPVHPVTTSPDLLTVPTYNPQLSLDEVRIYRAARNAVVLLIHSSMLSLDQRLYLDRNLPIRS